MQRTQRKVIKHVHLTLLTAFPIIKCSIGHHSIIILIHRWLTIHRASSKATTDLPSFCRSRVVVVVHESTTTTSTDNPIRTRRWKYWSRNTGGNRTRRQCLVHVEIVVIATLCNFHTIDISIMIGTLGNGSSTTRSLVFARCLGRTTHPPLLNVTPPSPSLLDLGGRLSSFRFRTRRTLAGSRLMNLTQNHIHTIRIPILQGLIQTLRSRIPFEVWVVPCQFVRVVNFNLLWC